MGLTAAAVLSRAKNPSSVQVTLSDGGDEPDAVLSNLRHNVEANSFLTRSRPAEGRLDVRVERLDWRDYLSPTSAPPDRERYDLLLGADLAYEPGQATLLHAAVSSLLRFPSPRSSPVGVADPTFWLCVPLRPTHTAEQAELASLFPLPSDPPDPALVRRRPAEEAGKSDAYRLVSREREELRGPDGFGGRAVRGRIGAKGEMRYWVLRIEWERVEGI